MGNFHREISVEKGRLTRLVRHGRLEKKKHGGRTVDEMTVISVRDKVMGPVAAGRLVIRSSNIAGEVILGSGWSGGANGRIDTRLRDSDGQRKGRVLYGILECEGSQPVVACALCYHLPRAGEIVIKNLEVARELASHKLKLFDALLRCADDIACEHSAGQRSALELDVPKDDARWYKDAFGFREIRKSSEKSRRILGRTTDGCRTKQKRAAGARPSQVAAEGEA